MSKRLLYLFIYLSICFKGISQINLVPNSSFEDTVGHPCWIQMGISNTLTTPAYFIKNWGTCASTMSPDVYNYCANYFSGNPYPVPASIPQNCHGYQYPHKGNWYAGIALNWFNYLPDTTNIDLELVVTKLKQPLKGGTCYYGEMYYSLSNIDAITINQLGMLVTQNDITANPFIFDNTSKYQIQADTTTFLGDTVGWTKISGIFVAQGGEQYLTVGNIRDGSHLKKQFINTSFVTTCGGVNSHSGTYVYIDDISLYELPNHTGTKSYTLCAGESLQLGDTVSLPVRYQWSLNGLVIDTTKNITIHANGASSASATYILQTKHCTIQTQTITITVNDCSGTEVLEVPNVFTPNNDNVNDTFQFAIKGISNLQFSVYNRWGNLIHQTTNNQNQTTVIWDGRTTSGEACSAGVYFYVLEYTNANGDVKKKNGYISLIK